MIHRLFCLFAALGWSISSVALFLDGQSLFELLGRFTDQPLVYQPMLDYWLRMTAAAFTFLGFLFLWAAIDQARTRPLARALGVFQLLCGAVLVWWSVSIGIPPTACIADILFCLVTGIGILATAGERGTSAE